VSLALIKPVNPYFSSEYAEAVMNSPIVYSQAKERVSGIGTPDLHLIEIRDFKIPLPPIEEQKEIVKWRKLNNIDRHLKNNGSDLVHEIIKKSK
jgi:type I restriction enzyme S subunit